MKTSTMRFLSKVLCIALVASFTLEAPLMASPIDAIRVNVGGQQVQVSPGQWIAVRQGTQITHYNVRYVNGQPVALEMSQYVKLIFGGTGGATAGSVANAGTTSKPSSVPSSSGGTPSVNNSSPVSTPNAPSNTGGGTSFFLKSYQWAICPHNSNNP
ncbi:hypothetical protein HYY75_02660 [bacterium]|nr:hypothetical protein [bacterium]